MMISGMPSPAPIEESSQITSPSAPSLPGQLPRSGIVSTYTKPITGSVCGVSRFGSGGVIVWRSWPETPS
jgi:hypothetical protein